MKLGIFLTVLAMSYVASLSLALAHNGEVHDESVAHAEVKTQMSLEQMEQMVKLLQQLVTVLSEYKAQYGAYTPPHTTVPAYVAPVAHEEDEHDEDALHEEEEEHEHDMATSSTPAKTLVIEVEPHSGKTHVHIRYTDKAEEMFFIDPPLSDVDGIVSATVLKTGLTDSVVRAAIKFME